MKVNLYTVMHRDTFNKQVAQCMGKDSSLGSQHNVWRYHNLRCSKEGNSELETVIRNYKFKNLRMLCHYNASSVYLQVLKRSE